MPVDLVAYSLVPGKVFVKVPNERGRYMLTHECVVHGPCKHCGAIVGEPCYRIIDDVKKYCVGVHYVRDWAKWNVPSGTPNKARIDLKDVQNAETILDA